MDALGQSLLQRVKKARGKKHQVAERALAFKWMRILYRCWRDRTPYSEELYLARLAKRKNTQVQRLARAVQIARIASAGAV